MKRRFKQVLALPLAMLLSSSLALPACAAGEISTRVAQLEGDWVATLSGNTGCGASSMLVSFHLDAHGSGAGTATIRGHATGCPNTSVGGQTFNIVKLLGSGRGAAGLSCGAGCGWFFEIQVNRANDMMALTDIDRENPNNTPTGVAIKQ